MRDPSRDGTLVHHAGAAIVAAVVGGCLWIAVVVSLSGIALRPLHAAEAGANNGFAAVKAAFERIHADYVDVPDDTRVLRAAIAGMLASPKADPRRIDGAALRQLKTPALADLEAAFDSIAATAAIEPQQLADAAIAGMLGALDAQSTYIDPQKWRQNLAPPSGGVGLNLALGAGAVRVVGAIENGPADKAGIVAGDTLVAIDGVPVEGLALEAVIARLRGAVKTETVLTVAHGRGKPSDVVLVRAPVVQPSLYSGVQGDIGFLKLTRLTDQTPPNLWAAIDKIEAAPGAGRLRGYVLDLRDNAGGLLDTAVSVARMFMDNGLIATTTARDRETQRFEATDTALAWARPLVVLINENTAAGAEIIAAALQAQHRAVVIGMPSAGAGTIQTIFPLGEGFGALRLTTSRVMTPSGQPLEGRGIAPDMTVAPPPGDAAKPPQDPQLLAAVNYLRQGRR